MYKANKIVVLFLVLLLIFSQFNITAIAKSDDDDDNDSLDIAQLLIEDNDIPESVPGSKIKLKFSLKSLKAKSRNISITSELGDNNKYITFADSTYSQVIDYLRKNRTEDVEINFNISKDAKEGMYPVNVNFKYYDDDMERSNSFSKTFYIKVINQNHNPRLMITKISTNPTHISAGSNGTLRIFFENKGDISTTDVSVSLDGLDSKEGFFLKNGSNKQYISKVNSKSDSFVDFDINASRHIKSGGHELTVNFNYLSDGEKIEDSQKIYLNVTGKGIAGADLNIENIKFPTSSIKPGNNYELTFNVTNRGKLNANNIVIKAESSDIEAIVPKTQSIRKIETLEPGQTKQLTFMFTPTNSASSRNYPISINVEYEDEFNENEENKYVVNQYVGIYANNPKKDDEEHSSKPKLIINKYSFNPSLVQAGENFTMNLSFFNTNSDKAVKNIKIFLTSDEKTDVNSNSGGGNVFTPVDTSNTFYIDSIAPKGVVEKTITMFTVPDAQAKTYTITANFEYEDSNANEFTATELIGIPVIQKSKLDTGQLTIDNEIYANEFNPISLEFFNTGKVTLYNLMIRLEGDFQKENANYYVGNFETGSSDTFDASLMPTEMGPLEGEVVFTFEDSSGQTIEHREPFSTNVIEGFVDDFPDDFPPFEEEPTGIKKLLKNKWFWLGLIVALFFLRKFYKKRKAKKEDDALISDDSEDLLSDDDKGID